MFDKVITWPNGLTFFRLGVSLALIVAVMTLAVETLNEMQAFVLALVVLGFASDWLDGYLARRYPSQQSKLGEYLDPPADKLAIVSYMLYLFKVEMVGPFEGICFIVIILREVFIVIWRAWGGPDLYPVNGLGKWKAGSQMVALAAYGLVALAYVQYSTAATLLAIATALTVWSLWVYVAPTLFGGAKAKV